MVRLSLNMMLGNQILTLPSFDIALVIKIVLKILDSSASSVFAYRCNEMFLKIDHNFPIIGKKLSGVAMPFTASSSD